MTELEKLLEKVKLENFISFMIYGTDSGKEPFENYEREIARSYDEIFEKLEKLYSEVNRKDDKLFDVVADFATLHDDIYFEAGLLIGFQLFKNLEQGYRGHKNSSLENILLSKEKQKTVMQQIILNRMNTALEETLRTDKEYQESINQYHKKMEQLDRNKFSLEQWEIIDEALSAGNERSAEYGRMAYQQGLLDVVNFMKDVFLSM
ncbi:MAG: hypothetical protein Q4D45_11880 [Lachnospiraceae bacterium]|nr:hypothetical protein [Lachnospiraceae bacterium]